MQRRIFIRTVPSVAALLGSVQGTASEVMREMNIVAPVKPRLVTNTNIELVG